jgi:hypothetical protein
VIYLINTLTPNSINNRGTHCTEPALNTKHTYGKIMK